MSPIARFFAVPSLRLLRGLLLLGGLVGGVSARAESAAATNAVPPAVKRNPLAPFSLLYRPEVRTAYISRGKVIEDRPMAINYARGEFDGGKFGRLGFWHFDVSSLTGRRSYAHRHAFSEVDWAVTYGYDVALAENWKLCNTAHKTWNTYHGYTAATRASEHSMSEWRFSQSLENPYVTPFWLVRTAVHPGHYVYANAGVRQGVRLPWDLTLTPSLLSEFGNAHLCANVYGAPTEDDRYRNGLVALTGACELAWRISARLTAFVEVGQFGLVSDEARRHMKDNKTNPSARRDLTYGRLGLRLNF